MAACPLRLKNRNHKEHEENTAQRAQRKSMKVLQVKYCFTHLVTAVWVEGHNFFH